MTSAKLGTFNDLLKLAPKSQHPILKRLRQIVLEIAPDACEVVRLGDRAATYGLGPKKMTEGFVYLMPHANWVNLGFYKGAALPDPAGLLEGTGVKLRHIKLRSINDTDHPALQALIQAALLERQQALAPSR
jgi:hypothetical protein